MILALDSGPLGMAVNPLATTETRRFQRWLDGAIQQGHRVLVSEVCDYEVRRELVRIQATRSIARLDSFIAWSQFLRITRGVMLRAADLWAEARRTGLPTADPAALDIDVILAAQVRLFSEEIGQPVIVVTTNARHLARFVEARSWQEIQIETDGEG
ncbi:MAG: nucleic acid-binding protein [Chloroflexi bacterium]|nr:nucleic acid-binding protein [Chloroflexota bacterium]